MFYAIDKNTNEFILSLNVRDRNYKDTYNKELRFKCAGSCENGKECEDDNVTFVNSKLKQSHFRHSSKSKCSAHKAYIEFNNNFYSNWFNLFKYKYRKPYWYNCKLEQIRDDNNVIMIRYSQQKSKIIQCIENYSQNKVIWILSLENRKYSNIKHYNGKIYVDFIGSKNDIPLYDINKSIVYLDTGTDIFLKVHLNSTSCYGQEIECINIYDICNEYEYLFIAYPYRQKDTYFRNLIKQQKEYLKQQEIELRKFQKHQEYLLSEYIKANNEYITNRTLENFHKMTKLYKKLANPKPIAHNREYLEHADKLIYDIVIIKCSIPKIYKIEDYIKKEIEKANYNVIIILQKLSELKSIYRKYFQIIEKLQQTYTNITYFETLVSHNDKYTLDLDLMVYNHRHHLKLENNIINNILYDEYIRELNILSEEYDWRIISYLEKQHEELKYKWYYQKNKEKIQKQKERRQKKLLKEKQEAEYKKELIIKRLKVYSQEYDLPNTQLISKLLDIIKDNYSQILASSTKSSNDFEYIKKYYTYITFPINHNLDKMILYIIKQEEYLQNI